MTIDRRGERHANIWCSREHMPEAGWTVSVLLDTALGRMRRRCTSVVAALLFSASPALAGAIVLQRRARLAERMEMQAERAQAELEHRVEERTADLALVNRQLETEVAERRATEQQLRQTQSDLDPGRQARRRSARCRRHCRTNSTSRSRPPRPMPTTPRS